MAVTKRPTFLDGRPDPEADLGTFRSVNWFLASAFEQNLEALKKRIDDQEGQEKH
ncbi:hypothetical protein [Robbsia andropogonis]|uniref:hypothetical protein n=1 Tax=Robbsia andropogonis TaxID=28092 RepID=UPI000A40BDE7|nr:hypothetical protein [Robbsia andropogonis]